MFVIKFCLRTIFNKFGAINCVEVSLERNEYEFSVDWNAIDKLDILNIHRFNIIIGLFSFSGSRATKCISLNNKQLKTLNFELD